MAPRRRCIACRREAPPQELLRLVADPQGQVLADLRAKAGGRGAWVCPAASCVEKIEQRPAQLARALRSSVCVDGLAQRLQLVCLESLKTALSLAARAGCVTSGGTRLRQQLPRGGFLALLVAADASPRSVEDLLRIAEQLPVFHLPMDREALGAQVGKGPRALLAIRAGKPSRPLIGELHRYSSLGYHPAVYRVGARSEATSRQSANLSREKRTRGSSPPRRLLDLENGSLTGTGLAKGSACPRKTSSTS